MQMNSDFGIPTGSVVRLPDNNATKHTFAVVLDHLDDGELYVAHCLPATDSTFILDATVSTKTFGHPLGISLFETSILKAQDLIKVGSLDQSILSEYFRQKTLLETRRFSRITHSRFSPFQASRDISFKPGITPVPYSGRVFGEDEVCGAVDSCLDFWLTLGQKGLHFERSLAKKLGVKHSILTNSGSSANLLAVSALTSHKIPMEKRILPGDEIITCAAGFPTTVAPIIQNHAIPVLIDCDPVTGNPDFSLLEEAYKKGKTKAVIFAHTLGNPYDLCKLKDFCATNDLWMIEDNCDALGSRYIYEEQGAFHDRQTGTFGDLSTQSFYPPHHITMGEGGSVNIVTKHFLKSIVESFRDWGRDCWCPSGIDNTCKKRYEWKLGDLPLGYDHKYIYSHLGYNLKPLDLQAAIGQVQLGRLPEFTESRIRNWDYLRKGLDDLGGFFEFALPTHASGWTPDGFTWKHHPKCAKSLPSWFGFTILVRPEAPFSKVDFTKALDNAKIGNRGLFGGNLARQPAFHELKRTNPTAFRTVGNLHGADRIMNECVFIGVYPGLTTEMLDYVIDVIHQFCHIVGS